MLCPGIHSRKTLNKDNVRTLASIIIILREHPFNLKGGGGYVFFGKTFSVCKLYWKKYSVCEMGRKKYSTALAAKQKKNILTPQKTIAPLPFKLNGRSLRLGSFQNGPVWKHAVIGCNIYFYPFNTLLQPWDEIYVSSLSDLSVLSSILASNVWIKPIK